METLIRSDDFQSWVSGKISEKNTYNFSGSIQDASWFSLDLQIAQGFKTSLASNLINDINLNFALAQILAPSIARANYDFDKLFIPYRCLAAEIFSQQQVVLSKGSLSDAVRATLSVPLFYRPIRIDKRYLYDGGVYNNFPVDVAMKEFKPDIVIGG